MNYQLIHDCIIDRARTRPVPDTFLMSHHVLPKCEGGAVDGEQVLLTYKEHRLVHWLRWKFTEVYGNKKAYMLMYNRSEEYYRQLKRYAGSLGGSISGKLNKKNGTGIFGLTKQQLSENGKITGNNAYKNKTGFHHPDIIKELTKKRCMEVSYNNVVYESRKACAKAHNVSDTTIGNWIKKGKVVVTKEPILKGKHK